MTNAFGSLSKKLIPDINRIDENASIINCFIVFL